MQTSACQEAAQLHMSLSFLKPLIDSTTVIFRSLLCHYLFSLIYWLGINLQQFQLLLLFHVIVNLVSLKVSTHIYRCEWANLEYVLFVGSFDAIHSSSPIMIWVFASNGGSKLLYNELVSVLCRLGDFLM